MAKLWKQAPGPGTKMCSCSFVVEDASGLPHPRHRFLGQMMRENNSDNPHAVFYTLPSPKQMRTGTMTTTKVRQDCLPILIG